MTAEQGPMKFNALIPELDITDLSVSLPFYRDILGFAVAYSRPEEGFAFLVKGEAQLMLDTAGMGRTFDDVPPNQRGRGVNFQIIVGDLNRIIGECAANEIPLHLPLEEKWYRINDCETGNRQIAVRDPDGYLLRLFEDLGTRPLSA